MSEHDDGMEGDLHWFASGGRDLLIYKINRRPLYDLTLFDEFRPTSVLEHLLLAFTVNPTTRTGRRFQRDWRVGNVVADRGSVVGLLGWTRHGEALSNVFDEASQTWREEVVPDDTSAVAPFAIDLRSEWVGVLRHPSFTEKTVANVLTNLLNSAERNLEAPSTSWAVEPVGDPAKFERWLERVDRVLEVKFVFRRPNPDGEEAFEEFFRRLDRLAADQIAERVTARDPEQGLDKGGLREDPTSQGFLAAAMRAYGYVVGRGYRGDKRFNFDQRSDMLKVSIGRVGNSWTEAMSNVRKATRRAARRRSGDGEPTS